jgi:adenylate cyclase
MSDMPKKPKVFRRLAAILAADIAGYSALMGADEEATVRDLKAHQAVVLPMVSEHGGAIIREAGDDFFAAFPSVLGAVKCALAIQQVMDERNAPVDPAKRMQHRIGINQGDVVSDGTRMYGAGVFVAARLQEIAEPGGICISSKVHEEIIGKIQAEFENFGQHSLKNVAVPAQVYRIRPTLRDRPASPDKPRITERQQRAALPQSWLPTSPATAPLWARTRLARFAT